VETISTFESMLLGDPFDFLSNVPQMLSNLPSCSVFRQLYRNNTMRNIFTKIGATEILLFYKFFPDKQVTIYPNKRSLDCSCIRSDELGKNIVRAAKEIIIKQKNETKQSDFDTRVSTMQLMFDAKIDNLENKINHLGNKLDLILKKL